MLKALLRQIAFFCSCVHICEHLELALTLSSDCTTTWVRLEGGETTWQCFWNLQAALKYMKGLELSMEGEMGKMGVGPQRIRMFSFGRISEEFPVFFFSMILTND